jgi:hypothetical protein
MCETRMVKLLLRPLDYFDIIPMLNGKIKRKKG